LKACLRRLKIFFRDNGQLFRNPVREELPTIRPEAFCRLGQYLRAAFRQAVLVLSEKTKT
jgi:hypothetical protein